MPISFSAGQRLFFFAILFGVTLFFLWMVRGYLFPIFWAIVFALLLHPAYHALHKRIGNNTVTALIVMLAALLLVIIPLSWLGTKITQEAYALYRTVATSGVLETTTLPPAILNALESLNIDVAEARANVASLAQTASAWIFSEALSLSSATFNIILKTFLMLYLLFFFLRDGERLGAWIMHRLPLGDRREKALFDRFARTTRAIMKGTVVTALVQGAIGAALFWFAGIENAILWGTMMAFFAIIPAVGPAIVWLPAGLYLLATGALAPALIILIGGVVLISPVDNVLKPVLVGRDTKMPDALILISILGGIGMFGITGIIVGPVVAALALAVWDMFAEEFNKELAAQG